MIDDWRFGNYVEWVSLGSFRAMSLILEIEVKGSFASSRRGKKSLWVGSYIFIEKPVNDGLHFSVVGPERSVPRAGIINHGCNIRREAHKWKTLFGILQHKFIVVREVIRNCFVDCGLSKVSAAPREALVSNNSIIIRPIGRGRKAAQSAGSALDDSDQKAYIAEMSERKRIFGSVNAVPECSTAFPHGHNIVRGLIRLRQKPALSDAL